LNLNTIIKVGLLVTVIGIVSSCANQKDLVYFNGIKDSTQIDSVFWKEVRINKGDQLSITIASLNQDIDNVINKANSVTGSSNLGGENQSGYFVTEKGYLNLPRVGNLMVEGMTHAQLVDTLQITYREFTKDPIVSVRLLNFRVTVLGEVNKPGQLTFSTTNVDLYQAIGKAGDITNFGRRSDVLLIRQTDSSRIVRRIDLTDPSFIKSPYFQLQSGDLIYVEANRTKKNTSSLSFQLWPILTSGASLLIAMLGFATRL
jgi:polysaccharide export outer membrane protein